MIEDLKRAGLTESEARVAGTIVSDRLIYSVINTHSVSAIHELTFMSSGLIWRELVLMQAGPVNDAMMALAKATHQHFSKGGYRDESYDNLFTFSDDINNLMDVELVRKTIQYSAIG